jgi:alpha-tubulin suppressor-like RCC1 family protein
MVVQVLAEHYHTTVLTVSGQVWTVGYGSSGNLGNNSSGSDNNELQRVRGLEQETVVFIG